MLYRCSWTRCLLNLPDFSYFAENVVTFYALTSLRCNCAQKPIQKRDEQNKCIGDDTKAAARQSPICIKKQKKIKYGEKRFAIWRMELLHPAMWHDHDIDFARVTTTHCNVACGSGIVTVNSPITKWQHPAMWHIALGSWLWIRQVVVPCNVAGGWGMTCYRIRPNVRHTGILHLVSILTISP